MKLDNFIKRPVLSTVISIIIVILGILGLVSIPVTQYPDIAPPYRSGKHVLHRSKRGNGAKQRDSSVGRANQWCGKHDVHDFYRYQHGRRLHRGIF